jgi:hypothetical protein
MKIKIKKESYKLFATTTTLCIEFLRQFFADDESSGGNEDDYVDGGFEGSAVPIDVNHDEL